jgi:carboxyl-terminal processing protease
MWCLIMALVALPAQAEDVSGLEDALADIEARFPATVGADALYRAALEGVARHFGSVMGIEGNTVLTQSEQKNHARWLEGHRTGIGAEFSIVGGRGLLITTVFLAGPADTAGLHAGDLVVSMDDHPFTGLSPAAIHARVRRARGSSSVLDLRRRDGSIRRITVERGAYQLPTVRPLDGEGATPVLRVPFFGRGTAAALASWLREQRAAAAVVLDLRDNAGGALEEVIKAADLFLEPGAIVVNRGRERAAMEPITASEPAAWAREVVVLINQGTEGGAEAFAAALRDNGRCVLVGTRSGGRAVDTSIYEAGRGFVLRLADTHLSAPSGISWTQRGLAPNVVVEAPDMAIPVSVAGGVPDLQRDTAIRLISSASHY